MLCTISRIRAGVSLPTIAQIVVVFIVKLCWWEWYSGMWIPDISRDATFYVFIWWIFGVFFFSTSTIACACARCALVMNYDVFERKKNRSPSTCVAYHILQWHLKIPSLHIEEKKQQNQIKTRHIEQQRKCNACVDIFQ